MNAIDFEPNYGNALASCSTDQKIFLWNVYGLQKLVSFVVPLFLLSPQNPFLSKKKGDCVNYSVLSGHKNAVLNVKWTCDGEGLVSCSADKTAFVWDSETGNRSRRLQHKSIVNDISVGNESPNFCVTGADEKKAILWDLREKNKATEFGHSFQVTSVAFSESSSQVLTGGIDPTIRVFDIRLPEKPSLELEGHRDTLTSLQLSKSSTFALSNSKDNTLRIWDVKPFSSTPNRCLKLFEGNKHNFENNLLKCSWSADGRKIGAGSADRFVYVWDTTSRNLLYRLPGHSGVVFDVKFHPKEPIIASSSSDGTIFLGEIEP